MQTDFDGRFSYSEIVAVNFNAGNFSIFPNPSAEYAYLNFYSVSTEEININIFDLGGRSVLQLYKDVTEGDNLFQLPTHTFAKGIYHVVISRKDIRAVQKLIVR